MGQVYVSKVRFHPREDRLRQAYVAMLLKLADNLLDDQPPAMPGVILMRLDEFGLSDSVEINMVCFDSVPELSYVHKFMGATKVASRVEAHENPSFAAPEILKNEEVATEVAKLKVYECKAYDWSPGRIIVAAVDTQQVNELYARDFSWRPLPFYITEWQGVMAVGEPRVLYDGDTG